MANSQHVHEQVVQVPAGEVTLEGNLTLSTSTRGMVLFAHGSGSSRHSPRNRFVASQLHAGGLATFLIDLLSAEEEQVEVPHWLPQQICLKW